MRGDRSYWVVSQNFEWQHVIVSQFYINHVKNRKDDFDKTFMFQTILFIFAKRK